MKQPIISLFAISLLAAYLTCGAQLKSATQSEEGRMTGRLVAAIEDVGGGYTREGLSRFAWINKELERREYSLWTRWTAHRWYAQALLDSGKAQAALDLLQKAAEEAKALPRENQRKTAEEETEKLVTDARQKLLRK